MGGMGKDGGRLKDFQRARGGKGSLEIVERTGFVGVVNGRVVRDAGRGKVVHRPLEPPRATARVRQPLSSGER